MFKFTYNKSDETSVNTITVRNMVVSKSIVNGTLTSKYTD